MQSPINSFYYSICKYWLDTVNQVNQYTAGEEEKTCSLYIDIYSTVAVGG